MEQYLRLFISYKQDGWPDWLPSAEFSSYNHSSSSIYISPFFASYGYHPAMGIELPRLIDKTTTTQRSRLQIEDADKFANKMNQPHQFLREEMTYALCSGDTRRYEMLL